MSFILRRLFLAIFVLIGVITITFILSHSLGGDPIVAWLGKSASLHPALAKAYAIKYHLTDPLWVQYYYYITGLLQGNFGFSPSRGFVPVTTVIAQTLPYTLQIAVFAIIVSIVLGVLLGVVAARYHHTAADKSIRAFYLAGISSPSFFIALILLIVFTFEFHLLPSGGAVDPTLQAPRIITDIPMLDALIEGKWAYLASSFEHVILPGMALALGTFGVVVRILRSSMLDVMRANYVRTAEGKGIERKDRFLQARSQECNDLRNYSVISNSHLVDYWDDIRRKHLLLPGNGSVCFHSSHRSRLPRDTCNYDSFCDHHHFVKPYGRHSLCYCRPADQIRLDPYAVRRKVRR